MHFRKTVGATLAVARKPSPFQGEGAERSEADEGGSGMAEAPRRAGQCPAPTAFTGQAFVLPHVAARPWTVTSVGRGLLDAPPRTRAGDREGKGGAGREYAPGPAAIRGPPALLFEGQKCVIFFAQSS